MDVLISAGRGSTRRTAVWDVQVSTVKNTPSIHPFIHLFSVFKEIASQYFKSLLWVVAASNQNATQRYIIPVSKDAVYENFDGIKWCKSDSDGSLTMPPVHHVPWLFDQGDVPLAPLACMTYDPGVWGSKPVQNSLSHHTVKASSDLNEGLKLYMMLPDTVWSEIIYKEFTLYSIKLCSNS